LAVWAFFVNLTASWPTNGMVRPTGRKRRPASGISRASPSAVFGFHRQPQPIFAGGALKGNVRLAESQERQELIAYKQAIQLAFRDVSDALIAYQQLHEVRLRQEDTVRDLQQSVRLSDLRYPGGTTRYLEVLDGQRSLFSAEVTLALQETANIKVSSSFTGRSVEAGSSNR
jgi:outer membrane protein TolC